MNSIADLLFDTLVNASFYKTQYQRRIYCSQFIEMDAAMIYGEFFVNFMSSLDMRIFFVFMVEYS